MPSIRRVSPGSIASGDGWMGLRANNAYCVSRADARSLGGPIKSGHDNLFFV
ncbi:MAG TPA: hypothetical protein VGG36_10010 [Rhizomicrobium sp.]|jgi:hypothetical protein